jgi:hypothetical protein
MLIYHPAFDLHHCVYRLLLLLSRTEGEVEVERLRIWDFYFVFPREAKLVSIPNDKSELRALIHRRQPRNPYEDLVNPKRVMKRMESYQLAALNCLASYDFIEKQLLEKMLVKRTDKSAPPALEKLFTSLHAEQSAILELISGLNDLPLTRFKQRTGLLEYKYDAH